MCPPPCRRCESREPSDPMNALPAQTRAVAEYANDRNRPERHEAHLIVLSAHSSIGPVRIKESHAGVINSTSAVERIPRMSALFIAY